MMLQYISLWQVYMISCSFNGCEWFLTFFSKIHFLKSIYLYVDLAAISLDESQIWWFPQIVLQCDQWFHHGLKLSFHYLLPLERTLWALPPLSCLFLFALHLEWCLNKSVDKKSNAIFIFAKLCSNLVNGSN